MSLSRFMSDQSGAIVAFTVVTFLTMFIATGMAVDFMRHESQRAELQDALDRGILAAVADASAQTDAQISTIVQSYLNAVNSDISGYVLNVANNSEAGRRAISAELIFDVSTLSLRLIGIPNLEVTANAAVGQSVTNMEISMVLDISQSMAETMTTTSPETDELLAGYDFAQNLDNSGSGPTRLDTLRVATDRFLSTILNQGDEANASVSLIPQAGHVNAGSHMFDRLASARTHAYSNCIEMDLNDFSQIGLPSLSARSQVPHMQFEPFAGAFGYQVDWGSCPSDAQAITYFSDDLDALRQDVANLRGHDGSGPQIGMKWALSLLDPSFNSHISAMIAEGSVDEKFASSPQAFNSDSALKVIVLLSDGVATAQIRPLDVNYQNPDLRDYYASSFLTASESTLPTPGMQENDQIQSRGNFMHQCALARANDVLVFTIGLDVPAGSAAETDLQNCATTPEQYLPATGSDISNKFDAIAVTLSKLKLTQ